MIPYFCNFWDNEDGAVTVDFVVVTAAIVIIGLLVGSQIREGSVDLAEQHEQSMKDQAQLLSDRMAEISF